MGGQQAWVAWCDLVRRSAMLMMEATATTGNWQANGGQLED
jgi:hypothetical protein